MDQIFVWTISDVLSVAVFVIIFCAYGVVYAMTLLKQLMCKHDGRLYETQACDAICGKCGKNLGFIGNIRLKNSHGT